MAQNTAMPKKQTYSTLAMRKYHRAIFHAPAKMVLVSMGSRTADAMAVGIREYTRPEAALVRNQVSRRRGRAWSALHIRVLYRSPKRS